MPRGPANHWTRLRYSLSRELLAGDSPCSELTPQLAYLVGLPPNEVPAVEIARGDLVEVTPASYGVVSRAFHFWSGEGRGDLAGGNLYENFAEATTGKGRIPAESGVNFAADAMDMEREARDEQDMDKERKKRMSAGMGLGLEKMKSLEGGRGTASAPPEVVREEAEEEREELFDEQEGEATGQKRDGRASELFACFWPSGKADFDSEHHSDLGPAQLQDMRGIKRHAENRGIFGRCIGWLKMHLVVEGPVSAAVDTARFAQDYDCPHLPGR